MTRDELKKAITPIVCDLSLSKEQREVRLIPYMRELLGQERNNDAVFNIWNGVMAEIVEENNLEGANG